MSKRRKRPGSKAPRMVARGYSEAGASTTRRALKGFEANSGSPARDIDDNNLTLRQRSRMLYMGAPVATSAVRTVRTNVVGTGLVPRPRIDRDALGMADAQAEEWQARAKREFSLWADDRQACDALGLNTFAELQQLAMQSWLMSGDVFALVRRSKASRLRPYTLRLQLVEADRVSTPAEMGVAHPGLWTTGVNPENGNRIYDGVEVGASGAVVAYHVCSGYPYEYDGEPRTWQRVLARGSKTGQPQVLHLMEAERPDQYRGVPYLAQAIEPLLQMRRYTNAELMAAVVQAFFTAFVKTEDPTDNPFNEVGPGDVPGGAGADPYASDDENELELGPGTVNYLKENEDVVFADPSRPASGFQSFIEAMATQVGAALEIPKDLLLKQFNSSYSASRAALMEAWKSFRMRRRWLVDDLCRPVWELFVSEAVATGRLRAPGFFTDPVAHAAYLGCEWIGPSQGQLDPTKEIQAEIAAVEQGITTREAASVRINGSEWEDNIRQLRRENQMLREAQAAGSPPAAQSPPSTVEGAGEEPDPDGEGLDPDTDETTDEGGGAGAEPAQP